MVLNKANLIYYVCADVPNGFFTNDLHGAILRGQSAWIKSENHPHEYPESLNQMWSIKWTSADQYRTLKIELVHIWVGTYFSLLIAPIFVS